MTPPLIWCLTRTADASPHTEPLLTLTHDAGAADSLQPLPALMLWPFDLALDDEAALQSVVLQARRQRGAVSAGEDGSPIGLLDAADVHALHASVPLTVPAAEGLQSVQSKLYEWLARRPELSAVGERALAHLSSTVAQAGDAAHFTLNLQTVFAPGQDFERVLAQRVLDILQPDWSTGDEEEGPAPLDTATAQLRRDLLAVLGMDNIGREDEQADLQASPAAAQLHALRMAMLRGDWDAFAARIDPQDVGQAYLIAWAYERAVDRQSELLRGTTQLAETVRGLRMQRDHLWFRSGHKLAMKWALDSQIDLAHSLRQKEQHDSAVALMRETLADYQPLFDQGAFQEPHLLLLSNLSFAYIKLVDQPQAAFDLLAPVVKSLDAGSHEDATEQQRAMIRANLRAAVVHLQQKGIDVPVEYRSALSSADEAQLEDWDKAYNKAMADKRPADALALAEQALALLNERGVGDTRHQHLAWSIDQARAWRDLGQAQRALEALQALIARAERTQDMHARQNVPRAYVALALTQGQLGLTADECASYRTLLNGPYANLPNPIIARNVRIAHQNLASELDKQGDSAGAYTHYWQGHHVAVKLGQASAGADLLWWAYKAAEKLNDLPKQQQALQTLCDTYATSTDEQAQKRWSAATGALDIIKLRANPPKTALGRMVQGFLNLTKR